MLKVLDKLFWLAIYVIALAVLLLLGRLVAYWLDWPAWTTAALALGCVVAWFGARQGLRWWRRRREEKMAARLLEADQGAENEATPIDPELATRMNLTWKAGLTFLGNSRLGKIDFAYKLPWYIAFGDDDQERAALFADVKVKGADAKQTIANPEFSWHFARNAVWLDLPFGFGNDGDDRWRLFAADLVRKRGKAPLGGVMIMGDARRLLSESEEAIKERAALVRSRLDTLIKATGARVPVYVLISGIDAIYGMRALVGTLPGADLDRPFGAFRTDERESPAAFAARLPREAAVALAYASRSEEIDHPLDTASRRQPTLLAGQAAAFQAPDELPRLSAPLSLFCREAFSDNPYQMVPLLRGIFLGSSGVSSTMIPSLLSRIPSFRPEAEEMAPSHVHRPWFFADLLDEWIPKDPAPTRAVRQRRHVRAVSAYSGLVGLLAGTLVLCWLLTFSFLEAKAVLASAAPESFDHLAPDDPETVGVDTVVGRNILQPSGNGGSSHTTGDYQALFSSSRPGLDEEHAQGLKTVNTLLDSAMQVELRNRQWHLPRFGMIEPLALQENLRDAFCRHYFSLVLKPALDAIAENAVVAARSSDPTTIGNSMVMLMALRAGLENRLSGKRPSNDVDYFFSIADVADEGAIQSQARARLEMYLHWVDIEPWMRGANDTFLSLERNIISDAAGGNVMAWLPDWVEGLNSVQPVDTASVWAPVSIPSSQAARRTVRGAWTKNGYEQAARFLGAVVYDPTDDHIWAGRRDALLAQYRARALAAWRDAVYELWRDYQANIDDADLPTLIKQIASGTGPTSRMNDLLAQNLLPLFDGDSTNPDIEWLRRNNQLRSSATGLLAAAGPESAGASFLSKLSGAVSDAMRKIGSDDNIALLSRNIGFSAGNEMMSALDNYGKLNKSFADVSYLTASRDTCIDLVTSQYRRTGASSATLSAAADASAGVAPSANGGDGAPATDISKNPFGDGKIAADALNAYLTGASGSSTWIGISPKAVYNYMRYLAARQAAIHLDARWMENVYNPALTSSGNEEERMDALFDPGGSVNTFLNQTAVGLWRVSGGKLVNSVWDELPFMFNDNFLNFCAVGIANASVKYPEKVSVNFRVDSVSVDSGARERPNEVSFIWQEGSENQELVYRNYVTSRVFDWKMNKDAVAAVIISFPTVTLVREFTGYKALGRFVEQFNHGQAVFQATEFPGQADALARLGVNRITIRATMQNQAQLLRFMNVEVPAIPATIITEPKKR